LTRAMAEALGGRANAPAGEPARRKRTDNMVAYDFLLRGIQYHMSFDAADTQPARQMFERAIALDPGLAPAYGWLAVQQLRDWWDYRSRPALDKAFALANRAVALDGNDRFCHTVLGFVRLERREFDGAAFHIGRAVDLNPNDPDSTVIMGCR